MKTTHITVMALKDHVQVITGVKKLRYVPVQGLNEHGYPEGQEKEYECTHGISLAMDQVVEIDIRDEQVPYFQKAVAAGDIEVVGLPAPAAPAPQAAKAK